jgi:peptide/nickel transport system substrate-binding protein
MLMSLSRYETAILNRKAVEEAGADYGSKVAVGCGPYRFTSWSRGDKVVLERYDEYFGGPAKIDRLVYRGIPEDATRLIELESGGIDLIPANFPYAEFVNFQGNKGFKTYTCPAMATNYLGLDVAVKPLDNKLARQAINYAVDKQAIVDAVYFGLGMPARGPLSPVIWGFDPNRGDAYPYNPEKARELLAEAGLAEGFDMTIFCDARTERTSTAELIQAYLADIGVRASIELMEWSALLSETAKGIGGGFLLGWTGTGDADGGLVPIIHSANIGSSNRFRYSNKNLDDLLDRGGAELDQDARLKIYAEAQELIVDECPLLFLAVQEITAASSKSVEGFRPYPNFIPPLHGVSLSE